MLLAAEGWLSCGVLTTPAAGLLACLVQMKAQLDYLILIKNEKANRAFAGVMSDSYNAVANSLKTDDATQQVTNHTDLSTRRDTMMMKHQHHHVLTTMLCLHELNSNQSTMHWTSLMARSRLVTWVSSRALAPQCRRPSRR